MTTNEKINLVNQLLIAGIPTYDKALKLVILLGEIGQEIWENNPEIQEKYLKIKFKGE